MAHRITIPRRSRWGDRLTCHGCGWTKEFDHLLESVAAQATHERLCSKAKIQVRIIRAF